MSLTPHINDANREKELERRKYQPETFGRTEIPASQKVTVLGNAEATALAQEATDAIAKMAADKEALKVARKELVVARELAAQAELNLKTAVDADEKEKVTKPLIAKRDEAVIVAEAAEELFNNLIDS